MGLPCLYRHVRVRQAATRVQSQRHLRALCLRFSPAQLQSSAFAGWDRAQLEPRRPETAECHHTPSPPANGVTPAVISKLADVLCVPDKGVQDLLAKHPQLASLCAADIQHKIETISSALQLSRQEVAFMVYKQPVFCLETPVDDIVLKLDCFSQCLQLPRSDISKFWAVCPSATKREASAVHSRIHRVCSLFGWDHRDGLRIIASAPEFLTASYKGLEKRSLALASVLQIPLRRVSAMLRKQPDLLFMSPRIMQNKVRVLSSIFDRPYHEVVMLVVKAPKLLRSDMDKIRCRHEQMQKSFGRTADFAFCMISRHPRMLYHSAASLTKKAKCIKHVLISHNGWMHEWHAMSPEACQECISATLVSYRRLEYIIATGQEHTVTLHHVLTNPLFQFCRQFPDYTHWLRNRMYTAPMTSGFVQFGLPNGNAPIPSNSIELLKEEQAVGNHCIPYTRAPKLVPPITV